MKKALAIFCLVVLAGAGAAFGQAFADSVGGVHVIQTCEGSSEKQLNDIKALVAKAGKEVVFLHRPQ
jgi:hypothetical protein